MGFFSEIRKLLFGVESVTKSAAGKAFEAGKDATASAMDKSGELFDKAKDKVEDIGEDVLESAGNIWEKAVDVVEDVGEKVMDKAGDVIETVQEKVESVGEKVLDATSKVVEEIKEKGADVVDKAADAMGDVKDAAGNVGDKIKEAGSEAIHKVKEFGGDTFEKTAESVSSAREYVENKADDLFNSGDENTMADEMEPESSDADDMFDQAKEKVSDLGTTVLGAKSEMVDKAKEIVDDLGNKLDETLEKAQAMAAKDATSPEYKAPSDLLDKNLLEDKDDFFKKAEAFADGRYEEVTDPFAEAKPKIIHNPDPVVKSESPSEPLPGFEDLDGDGNEIVDDALIISEEE